MLHRSIFLFAHAHVSCYQRAYPALVDRGQDGVWYTVYRAWVIQLAYDIHMETRAPNTTPKPKTQRTPQRVLSRVGRRFSEVSSGCGKGAGCVLFVVIEQVTCRYREAPTMQDVTRNLLCSAPFRL